MVSNYWCERFYKEQQSKYLKIVVLTILFFEIDHLEAYAFLNGARLLWFLHDWMG